jgi:hypothetical protein
MRPADECDALARDVRARRQIRERSERVEATPCRRDRALAVADRADLARAARAEAVGKEHGVAVAQPRIGTQRESLGQLAFAAGPCRVHAAATVQRDDRGNPPGGGRARRQQQDAAQRHRSRGVVVERFERHRSTRRASACAAAATNSNATSNRFNRPPGTGAARATRRALRRSAACMRAGRRQHERRIPAAAHAG